MKATANDVILKCFAMCDKLNGQGEYSSGVGKQIITNRALHFIDIGQREILSTLRYEQREVFKGTDINGGIELQNSIAHIAGVYDLRYGKEIPYVITGDKTIQLSAQCKNIGVSYYMNALVKDKTDELVISYEDAMCGLCYFVCAMILGEYSSSLASMYLDMYNIQIEKLNIKASVCEDVYDDYA